MTRRKVLFSTIFALVVAGVAPADGPFMILQPTSPAPDPPPSVQMTPGAEFSTLPDTFPGSFPSLGYEATSTDEFGDHIGLAGVDRDLQTVRVSLTNWACENDFDDVGGSWVPNRGPSEACVTTPGSGYMHPITLNLYQVDNTGPDPAVGALIATKTASFFIPFRPSWDSVNCAAGNPGADVPFGGTWYDPVLAACVHGYAFVIDFDFSADGITLPDEVIYGVAYDTADYGAAPIGAAGPYNSLNVSVNTAPPYAGTDVEPGTVFWDTSYGPFYCDGGVGGTDTFRRDADCWDPYVPVVEFLATSPAVPTMGPGFLGLLGALLLAGLGLTALFVPRRRAGVQ
jgi:hypothetical protein